MLRNDQARYGIVAQALHWLIAALIVVTFGLGWYMADLPFGQHKFDLYQLHKSLGITILGLAAVRLLWRGFNPAPPLPPHLRPWERTAAVTISRLDYGLGQGEWAWTRTVGHQVVIRVEIVASASG